MEYHRQQLQGRLAVQMTGNEGEVHSQLTNRQQTLSATLNRLRGVVIENNTKCQELKAETSAKKSKLTVSEDLVTDMNYVVYNRE